MMNIRTFWHGGEPKKGISLMSGLLLIKPLELWDHRLKRREFSTLYVCARIYVVPGWAWRILRCSLTSTRIGPRMLGLGVAYPCRNSWRGKKP